MLSRRYHGIAIRIPCKRILPGHPYVDRRFDKTTPPVGATGGVGRSSRKTVQVAKGYDVGAVSFSFFFSLSLGGALVGVAVTLYCRSGV